MERLATLPLRVQIVRASDHKQSFALSELGILAVNLSGEYIHFYSILIHIPSCYSLHWRSSVASKRAIGHSVPPPGPAFSSP